MQRAPPPHKVYAPRSVVGKNVVENELQEEDFHTVIWKMQALRYQIHSKCIANAVHTLTQFYYLTVMVCTQFIFLKLAKIKQLQFEDRSTSSGKYINKYYKQSIS